MRVPIRPIDRDEGWVRQNVVRMPEARIAMVQVEDDPPELPRRVELDMRPLDGVLSWEKSEAHARVVSAVDLIRQQLHEPCPGIGVMVIADEHVGVVLGSRCAAERGDQLE